MRHLVSLALIAATFAATAACDSDRSRSDGQTSFQSAPPNGSQSGGATADGSAGGGAGDDKAPGAPPSPAPGGNRTVEETDLYRLEGNRLYYLNAYRGLMVFDVTNPDTPTLLGRSPIFGQPIDMIVRNGQAIVVIGDWFGRMDDGSPFHGSIVRGLDATDPAHIRVLGEAKLGGWVRDDRVVGDVIYAVSEDYGWSYGWLAEGDAGGGTSSSHGPTVVVSSVSFAGGKIEQIDELRFDGFTGVFNVTPNSIMLASSNYPGPTSLLYLDISDPGGQIVKRGTRSVDGFVYGWGADNGRWNLDFADGKTAHVIAQRGDYNGGYVLSTVDFANPDHPTLVSTLDIARSGWSAAARFDSNRLYLAPAGAWFDGTGNTPLQVYDLTSAAAPRFAGTVTVPGQVWNILPAPGQRLFALGNDYRGNAGDPVSLQYLDVTNPAAPVLLGTSTFGQGWAWTPAAGTFKAFTMDAERGLVVLPFAGYDYNSGGYNNGLQLIQFTASTVSTAGAARTKGWVERGIFVGNRLVSLSNQALAVVDYSDPKAPRVVTELTLARNVITAQPAGDTIAEISSDWWDNYTNSSQVRILPIAGAEETTDNGNVPTVDVEGTGARVFSNGRYSYIVTTVRVPVPCQGGSGTGCYAGRQQIQIVDLAGGTATLRGKLQLPVSPWGWYGWGWWGFWWWDWWGGDSVAQIGGDALAFRRWVPRYDERGYIVDADSELQIVDLANPDAPKFASTLVSDDNRSWWGNMKVVGDTLYTTHYDWVDAPGDHHGWVRYYLDSVDVSDRAHPRVGARINVPGFLVGGNPDDPSIIYTIDYRWSDGQAPVNDFDVLKISGSRATLLSHTTIRGWVGSTFVAGKTAYLSAQQYTISSNGGYQTSHVDLHAIDLANPSRPRDRVASDRGWGWLLGVVGDRALVTSGWWGEQAIDVYKLRDGQPPQFDQTVRTRGWWVNGVSRQDQTVFLASGYWGVQAIPLR
jgi:hypothetical protein